MVVVVVVARPMEVLTVLIPFSASGALEHSRPIFGDFACLANSRAAMTAVAIRCASVLSAQNGRLATHPARRFRARSPKGRWVC